MKEKKRMKKYYGYSESSVKAQWPFFKGKWEKNKGDRGYVDVRYCGFCSKKDFIDTTVIRSCSARNWVVNRVSETGNSIDIELSDTHKDCVIVRVDSFKYSNAIIEIIPIKSKK